MESYDFCSSRQIKPREAMAEELPDEKHTFIRDTCKPIVTISLSGTSVPIRPARGHIIDIQCLILGGIFNTV